MRKKVKRAILKIHKAGGTGATDEWSKGYDAAISVALEILKKETGIDIEELLD